MLKEGSRVCSNRKVIVMLKARFLASVSLAALALPAIADVTPEDVWEINQRQFSEGGMTIETRSIENLGDRLTVRGLVASNTVEMDEGGTLIVTVDAGDVTYRANGDGTVTIEWANSMPVTVSGSGPEGSGEAVLNLEIDRLSAVASGEPGDVTTVFEFPSSVLTTESVTADGQEIDFDLNLTLGALVGTNRLIDGDMLRQVTDYTVESLSVSLNVTAPPDAADDGSLNLVYDMAGLAVESDGVVFDNAESAEFGKLLAEGAFGTGRISHTGTNTVLNAFEGGAPMLAYLASDEGGSMDVSFGEDGIAFSGVSNNGSIQVAGAEIPLPQVDLAYEDIAFGVKMPLIPSDDEQDFGLRIRFGGLTVSDLIWSMIDPSQQIPRDPATLEVDVSGSGLLGIDITDPEAMEAAADEMPGQVNSLSINAIELALAGARLTGSGAFEMDNSGMGPFAPAPTPVGSIDMLLTGGQELLDRLIAMGLLPQDQAMGFRMMLGMFARPGAGPDELVSTIEVTAEGAVLANGQRIR